LVDTFRLLLLLLLTVSTSLACEAGIIHANETFDNVLTVIGALEVCCAKLKRKLASLL